MTENCEWTFSRRNVIYVRQTCIHDYECDFLNHLEALPWKRAVVNLTESNEKCFLICLITVRLNQRHDLYVINIISLRYFKIFRFLIKCLLGFSADFGNNNTFFRMSNRSFELPITEESRNTSSTELTTVQLILQSTTLLIIMLLTIITNTSVIIVILRNENLRRNGHNILILNLAVTDLCNSLGSMLITYIAYFLNGRIMAEHPVVCSVSCILPFTSKSLLYSEIVMWVLALSLSGVSLYIWHISTVKS